MFRFFLLGAIQGLTEFLPVSSSAHLVFASALMSGTISLSMMVLLHIGTLIALLWFFRRGLWAEILRFVKGDYFFGLKVLLSTFLTIIVALPLEPIVNGLTDQPKIVSGILFGMGIILFATKFLKRQTIKEMSDFSFRDAVLIGFLQGFAVIPGISRSGITIVGLLLLGYKPNSAFVLSFFIGIPAIMGAALVELPKLSLDSISFLSFLLGIVSSASFGLMALYLLQKTVVSKKLYWFGTYCILITIILNVRFVISG